MPSILDEACDNAFETVLEMTGHEVTYTRESTVLTIDAIPAQSQWDEVSDAAYSVRAVTSKDFVFRLADIASLGTPEEKDSITDDGRTYKVMSPSGERPWRYSDRGRMWVRVHAKLTGET